LELLQQAFDIALHLDRHLAWVVEHYGVWVYAILFAIVFCETGLVFLPFLPGDSLMFVCGALAAAGILDPGVTAAVLIAAAVIGDAVNYSFGRYVGPRIFRSTESRWLNHQHLDRAHAFYVKHGGKAIVIARFVPIIRTYAPFVAGIGTMHYPHFLAFNVGGAVLWVGSLGLAGYLFGNMPWVKQNLTLVIIGIIVLSCLPLVVEWLRHRKTRSA